jgi:hypothetical protein
LNVAEFHAVSAMIYLSLAMLELVLLVRNW